MRIGSLFSGVGMLDVGLCEALGATVAWHVEFDPDASRVLEHHWPGVPNYGDITKVDWSSIKSVDVICGGPPCQPASSAGKQLGQADERWQWPAAVEAVRVLRPRLAIMENPSAILGLHGGEPWGWIIAALAEAGYECRWRCLRASDFGAPHRRERVFLVAVAADPDSGGPSGSEERHLGPVGPGLEAPCRDDAGRRGLPDADAPHPDLTGREGSQPAEGRLLLAGSRGEAPADPCGGGWAEGTGLRQGEPGGERRGRPRDDDAQAPSDADDPALDRQRPRPEPRAGGEDAADTDDGGEPRGEPESLGESIRRVATAGDCQGGVEWGEYEPAIRRYEAIRGPAPHPLFRGALSATFEEWLMGMALGWTDIGISQTARKRCVGNAVQYECAYAIGLWAAQALNAVPQASTSS